MPSGPVRPRPRTSPRERSVHCLGLAGAARKPGPGSQTREAVLEAARAIGYRPDRTASLLARRRTQLLGVTMDVSSPFHAELLEEVHVAADARGYDVVVSPLTRAHGESRAIETLLDFRCEALLLLGPALPEAALASLAAQHAVVAIGRRLAASGVDVVRAADDRGVALAVEHLAGLGHRAIVLWTARAARSPDSGGRATGRRSASLLGADAVQVVEGAAPRRTAPGQPRPWGPSPHGGRRVQRPMRARGPRPAPPRRDPRARAGVGRRLRRQPPRPPRHRRPHHSEPVPRAMAEAAVAAAVERLEGTRSETVDVVLPPHLVVRGTTAPPPAA